MVNYVEDIVCGVTQNEANIYNIENRISDTRSKCYFFLFFDRVFFTTTSSETRGTSLS